MRSDRLLATLLLLQAHGRLSATELARRLEVSVRTVYRDVEALGAAGVPVYTERGRYGGVALVDGYRTDATGLTADEARALFVFAGRDATAASGLDAALGSALRKLTAALPSPQRHEVDRARDRVLVEAHTWGRRAEDVPHLAALQQAVWSDRRVRITYVRSDQVAGLDRPSAYTLDPWGLLVKAGVWYLVAAHRGRGRLFRVVRVQTAEVLDVPADRPADLDLEAEWQRLRARPVGPVAEVDAVVRVPSDRTAAFLRVTARVWSAAPEVTRDHAAGLDTVSGRATSEAELAPLLLAFGAGVVVVAPASLRDAVATTATEVAAQYA